MNRKYFKYCEDDILELLTEHLAKEHGFGTFASSAELILDDGHITFVAAIGELEDRTVDCISLKDLYGKMDYNGSHGGKLCKTEQIEKTLEINLRIVVLPKEIADADYIKKICGGEVSKCVPYFDMWNNDALEALMLYMENNNYIIVPGTYILNQRWGFEDGYVIADGEKLEILKFTKKD